MAKNNSKIISKLVPEHCLALQKMSTLNPIAGIVPRGQSLRHKEQLLLVTSCDSPAGIGASLRTDGQRTDGQTDVEVEIVI